MRGTRADAGPGGQSLTPVELQSLRAVADPALTRDGRRVAFTVSGEAPARGERIQAAVWMGETSGGRPPAPLTGEDSVTEGLPAWSRDGHWLAFASDHGHPGRASPWVREPSGAVRRLADLDGSVESLRWSRDGSYLLGVVADPGSDRQGAGTATRIPATAEDGEPVVRRPGQAWRRIWRFDVASETAAPVSAEGVNVWEFGWAGDGPAVAVVSSDPSESAWYDAWIALVDLPAGTTRVVHRPAWQVQSPVIDADATRIAFVEGFGSDRTCLVAVVKVLDLGSGQIRSPAPQLDVAQLEWLEDGRLFYVGLAGLDSMCGYVAVDGHVEEPWRGRATLGPRYGMRATVSADGTVVAAAMEAPGEPQELCVLDARRGSWSASTTINAPLARLVAPTIERVAWAASDGVEIEGILMRPRDRGDAPLPLVVFIHGGPVGSFTFTFMPGPMAITAALTRAGYAVLLPNPRGSSGRGQEFALAVRGDMGGTELSDTLAGVEALSRTGTVDRARVGITGGSHGGYITAWAVTQTDAFAAAAPWACVSDWLSFHNTTNIGRFDELFLGSDPYDPTGHHFTRSPVTHARTCTTPTLILHGEEDLCTPLGQAQELYHALVEAGCETELVIYPRAGHGWQERDQVLDSCARITAWFDRHLAPDGDRRGLN
jgi:dipeptidyl aminopeptidase/acylaminoacyl peptidase